MRWRFFCFLSNVKGSAILIDNNIVTGVPFKVSTALLSEQQLSVSEP